MAPPRHEPVCTHQFNCNFVSAPLHSVVRDVTYALSARQCAASTTNWGVRPRSGIDLSTIVVLGGSVSCNRNVGNRTDADASAEPQAPDAPLADSGWPQQLAAILRWCGEQSVKVVNLCKGSTGTDYWLNRLRFDRAVRDAMLMNATRATNKQVTDDHVHVWHSCLSHVSSPPHTAQAHTGSTDDLETPPISDAVHGI